MSESHEQRQTPASDPAAGAPRPSRTGSVPTVGFDDPTLRPLTPAQAEYYAAHAEAHPEWHEHSDVPIRPLAWALGSIAALCLFSGVFLYVVFNRFDAQQRRIENQNQRTAVPTARPPVPEPRLEAMPGFSDNPGTQDVKALRDGWRKDLGGFSASPEQGFARVPIERAMDIAIERGMFKTAAGPATQPGSPQGGGGGGGGGAPARSPTRQGEVR